MDYDPDETVVEDDAMLDDEDAEFDFDDADPVEFDFGIGLLDVECSEVIPRLLEQLYMLRFVADEFNEHEFKRVSKTLRSHVIDDAIFCFYRESMENGKVRVDMHGGERDEDDDYASLLYHVCDLGCDYETIEAVHELNAQAEEYEVEAAVRGCCDSATVDLLLLRSEGCFPKGFFIRDSVHEESCVGFDFEMQDLARRISMTTTTQEVCLVHDEIKNEDLNDFIIAVSSQHHLTRLTIHGHFHEGCVAVPLPSVGELLNLVHLDLSVRSWGPNIAGPLSELVKTTTALTQVNLHYNDIGLEGMRLIYDALRFNKSILVLTLDYSEPLDGMLDVLDHNSTILNVRGGDQAEELRSWVQANFVGRRALFDAHCSKETFVDLLCSLKKESLDGWYERFGDRSHTPRRFRYDGNDFESVLLRTRPDIWST